MARTRTGSSFLKKGIVQIAIRTDRPGAPKPRWTRPCPKSPGGTPMSPIEARKVAFDLQQKYDRGEWDPWSSAPAAAKVHAPDETVDQYFERWIADRKRRGLTSIRTDRSRYVTHVAPVLGQLPMRRVVTADAERLVETLDASTRNGKSWKTAMSGWSVAAKMFDDARASKTLSLRVRPDNPCAGVRAPDRGGSKAKNYLWPSEFVALITCRAIDLEVRRLYALAVYLYVRLGELEVLDLADFDPASGTIHVHRALDYDTGKITSVKARVARRFSVEPNLLPLLRALHKEHNGRGRIWPASVVRNNDADALRKNLKRAGVTRADLFVSDATRKNLTAHDLRATGITWRAVRGDDPMKIQRAAGHTTFATTTEYIREAENVSEGFGEVFPPLPLELRERTPGTAPVPPSSEALATPSATLGPCSDPQNEENPRNLSVSRGPTLCEEGDLNADRRFPCGTE